jgi:hypothetical protein
MRYRDPARPRDLPSLSQHSLGMELQALDDPLGEVIRATLWMAAGRARPVY